jgi:hypothetical protein
VGSSLEPKDTFAVVLGEEEWILECNGTRLESFRNHHQARQAATALARMSHRRGRDADVVIEDERDEASSSRLIAPIFGICACAKLSLGTTPTAGMLEALLPLVL